MYIIIKKKKKLIFLKSSILYCRKCTYLSIYLLTFAQYYNLYIIHIIIVVVRFGIKKNLPNNNNNLRIVFNILYNILNIFSMYILNYNQTL